MMKKLFRPLLAASLLTAVVGLAGCQGQETAPPAQTPSQQTTTAPEAQIAAKLDQSGCLTALEGITQYEAGTAGSSLKAFIAAAQLVNFTQTFTPEQTDALTQAAADYLTALDAEALKAFTSHLSFVDETARSIIARDPAALDMLEDAGSPQAFDEYDLDRYEAAKAIIDRCLSDASYQTALDAITHYEPGTAGSSLKAYIAAAKLLNAAELSEANANNTFAQAADAYLNSLKPEERQAFADNLPLIDETARQIILGTDPIVQGMLEDAGSPQAFEHYDLDRYESLKAILDQSLTPHTDK